MKELNFREQAFVALYLESFVARDAARKACYSDAVADVHAHKWVSLTSCPRNKQHVYDTIQAAVDAKYGEDVVDSSWVLKRARLLADFNISAFVRVGVDKKAVYDFSTASDDDWYCISEYTVDQLSKGGKDDKYDVERTKIKGHCKLRALELVGKHVSVQAFKDNVDISGQLTQVIMTPEEYKKARQEVLASDDC